MTGAAEYDVYVPVHQARWEVAQNAEQELEGLRVLHSVSNRIGAELAAAGYALRTRNAELQCLLDEERAKRDELEAFVCQVADWANTTMYQRFLLVMRARRLAKAVTG